MKTGIAAALVLLLSGALAARADEVTCESRDNRRVECTMDTSGGVRLVRQLSSAACVENRSWGVDRHFVWVDDGCRAEFASETGRGSTGGSGWGSPGEVPCESRDNRRVECDLGGRGPIRLVRQWSNAECVEGDSWGSTRDGVWVANGCRAAFARERGGSGGPGQREVTCESRDNRRVECDLDGRGAIRLVRRLSSAQCVEGESFGSTRDGVWVANGCRGVFARQGGSGWSGSGGSSSREVACESRDNRRVECDLPGRGRPRLVRRLSSAPCVEGESWGRTRDRDGVWVANGCRGVFAAEGNAWGNPGSGGGLPREVTCESRDDRRTECRMETTGGVRMVRQLSSSACVEGRSWGTSRGSIWVSNGCRGVFATGGSGSSDPSGGPAASEGPPPPDRAVAACILRGSGPADLVRTTLQRPGYWRILLRFNDGEYACDVNTAGGVSSFERVGR